MVTTEIANPLIALGTGIVATGVLWGWLKTGSPGTAVEVVSVRCHCPRASCSGSRWIAEYRREQLRTATDLWRPGGA